jgi:rare lipoprotein A
MMKSLVSYLALLLGIAAPAATCAEQAADRHDGASLHRGSHRLGRATHRRQEPLQSRQTGMASYYWQPQSLASGGRFNPSGLTAAHRTLPFGTRVRVKHLASGRSVEVRINDRGPYVAGRIIDLSQRAAAKLGMTKQGTARISITVLGR